MRKIQTPKDTNLSRKTTLKTALDSAIEGCFVCPTVSDGPILSYTA